MRRLILLLAILAQACGGEARQPAAEPPPPLVRDAPGPPPADMVWIPGGQFLMGGTGEHAGLAELPRHPVEVDGFFMDVHDVTNAEFTSFVEATGYVTTAEKAPTAEEIMRQA